MIHSMTSDARVNLAPHYYHANFERLLAVVEARYSDLLNAGEQQILARIRALPFDARCLYIRLVSRSGPWFRESKLDYREIPAICNALDTLLAEGLARETEQLGVAEAAGIFTRAELQAACAARLPTGRFPRKADLLEAIEQQLTDAGELRAALAVVDTQRIFTPVHGDLVERLLVLFFGNRRQTLTEFVLDELGVTRYWPYRLDNAQRLFPDRRALDEYLACAELADQHRDARAPRQPETLTAIATGVLANEPRSEAGHARWQRLCNSLGRDLERVGELALAADLYQHSNLHPARERRARILERLGDWPAAETLCQRMLADPWCEAEQAAAGCILARVARKLGRAVRKRKRDHFTWLELTLPAVGQSVERRVAEQLAAEWQSVHYVENSLLNALFGLAFWEVIFAPLDGVFHNPYQAGPSDMYATTFSQRRASLIAARMQELREGDLQALLVDAYQRYQLFQCRWVDWRRINCELVATAAWCIPRAHLLAIFERLLFDPRENRCGFPDLIAFGNTPGEYRLIEVKGPGDALQDSQKRWLRYFAEQGIPAAVARVSWQDA